jgi:hypothetical protein
MRGIASANFRRVSGTFFGLDTGTRKAGRSRPEPGRKEPGLALAWESGSELALELELAWELA